MRRVSLVAVVLCVVGSRTSLTADVRTDQRVRFQLGGALGKMVNMFGGKGAREGVTTMVAVKGNRKVTMNDSTGQIIDLSEEKIYDLDLKKKTYKVTTFAELRRQMEEARKRPRRARARRSPASRRSRPRRIPTRKNTKSTSTSRTPDETKAINGFDTQEGGDDDHRARKGQDAERVGGMVMTTDMWLAPSAPSTKELAEFDMKYAQKLYGPMVIGASAQDMAMAMAMYPQMKPALDKMRAEGGKLQGTAILTDMRVEAVPPGTANQAAAPAPPPPAEEPKKKGFGGMLGGLKKMAEEAEKNKQNADRSRSAPSS